MSRLTLGLLAALAATPALAQTAPATGSPPGTAASAAPDANTRTLDSHRWRASSLMGEKLFDSTNATIGEIEDLIFTPDGGLTVIVSLGGGVLGRGKKLVALPYAQLQHSERWIIPGATKASVEQMPEFKFD